MNEQSKLPQQKKSDADADTAVAPKHDGPSLSNTAMAVRAAQIRALRGQATGPKGKPAAKDGTVKAPPKPEVTPEAKPKKQRNTLRRGDKGSEVTELQSSLNASGATLNADGVFGRRTKGAVKGFQSSNKLGADGVAGPITWAKLDGTSPQPIQDDDQKHENDCDHSTEPHDNDDERVTNPPVDDKTEPNKAEQKTELDDKKPAPVIVPPSGAAALKDPALATYLANLGNGNVDAAAHAVADVEAKSLDMAEGAKANMNEEKRGGERDNLVAAIGAARIKIGEIGPGLDPAAAAKAKGKLYRAAQAVAPYYSQGRNMNVLEGTSTRTCNITSLAMCLESLGVGAGAFSGSQKKVVAAAKVSEYAPRVKKAKGGSGSFSSLTNMRLPDFLQLVAIAECMSGTDHDSVITAAQKAWKAILGMGFLRKLAKRFGVGGSVHYFTTDTDKKEEGRSHLHKHGKAHRKTAYAIVMARNKWEQSGSEKDKKKYEKLRDNDGGALGGGKIDDRLPVETYKNAIMSQVGPELDAGKAVIVHMAGHYTRLAELHDTHIMADDPGSFKKANMKILWDEARALGYLKSRVVLG